MKDPDHISADSYEGGMAETDHGTVPEKQVQANSGKGIDEDSAAKGEQIGFVGQLCYEWQKK